MFTTFTQNVIALVSAGLGALLAITFGVSHRNLCALISFAAGTLFATTVIHIIPEASASLPLIAVLLALASGYFLFYFLSRFVFHVCPACAASHFDEQTAANFRSVALLLAVALGIHCIMDGIAIALGEELARRANWSIFLTITVHKFPEGLALGALLLKSGFNRARSLFVTSALESLTLLGWVLGSFLLQGIPVGSWFYLGLLHIGGGFVYLALHAVFNESKEHSSRYILFLFLLGIALVSLTNLIPL